MTSSLYVFVELYTVVLAAGNMKKQIKVHTFGLV